MSTDLNRKNESSTLLGRSFTLFLQQLAKTNIQQVKREAPNIMAMLAQQSIEINWEQYSDYLTQTMNYNTRWLRLNFSRKYADLLLNDNLSPLMTLTSSNRMTAMKALASLSKFLGCYEHWQELKKQYDLKWTDPDASLKAFEAIAGDEHNGVDEMQDWIKKVCQVLPQKYKSVIEYNLFTGLRPSEAIASIEILHREPGAYVKGDLILHVKYPKVFLRRTKKAYVSILTDRALRASMQYEGNVTYQAIRLKLQKLGQGCHLEYCRQIFATRLRQSGIDSEIVDLLQGRLPQSVFLRHYYRPNFKKEILKVKQIIEGWDF